MRVYHVSLIKNKASIMRDGINPAYSKGARKESWYVSPSLLPWAMLHVQSRHGVTLRDIVAFEVLVPRDKLTRRRRGVYTCPVIIQPLFVVTAVSAEGVAASYPCESPPDMMTGG